MPSRSSSSMMAPSLLQRHHERHLQGPRPAPLKVSTATTGTDLVNKRRRRLHHQQAPPARQPVIIYVESPRVVHAHPGEFNSIVQRLTGAPTPAPPSPQKMVFSAPPLQLQSFPFQFQFPMVGGLGAAGMLPLTSSIVSATDASGSSSLVQENLCSDPFLPPPSVAPCYYQHQYHGRDLFIGHHQ